MWQDSPYTKAGADNKLLLCTASSATNQATVLQLITQQVLHMASFNCSGCRQALQSLINSLVSLDTLITDMPETPEKPGNTSNDTAGISNLHPVFEQITGGWRAGHMD